VEEKAGRWWFSVGSVVDTLDCTAPAGNQFRSALCNSLSYQVTLLYMMVFRFSEVFTPDLLEPSLTMLADLLRSSSPAAVY
jgi:hypothetical protein